MRKTCTNPLSAALFVLFGLTSACGSTSSATPSAPTPGTADSTGIPSAVADSCSQTSVGLTPISDLMGSYQGFPGSLYGGGQNSRSGNLETRALAAARMVVPRGRDGSAAADGRIGFISIGHSIASQEFEAFISLSRALPINPAVTVIQGAKGGCALECSGGLQGDGYWTTWVAPAVQSAGLTAAQVQVAWVEETSEAPEFPDRVLPTAAQRIQRSSDLLTATLQRLKRYYPNVQIAYVSSNPYGGYLLVPGNPQIKVEPYLYEDGFAVRDVIARQGNSTPLLVWGPYQWADRLKPRSDGLVWTCSDYGPLGAHLGPQGAIKAAQLLVNFLSGDSAARIWLTAR